MPAYVVEIPNTIPGRTLPDGADTFLVHANDAADARSILKTLYAGDSGALIDSSQVTVTEVVADADMEGWTIRVRFTSPAGAVVADVTVTGAAAQTFDQLCATLDDALNATSAISNSVYGGSGALISSGIADGLGDHTVTAEVIPPATEYGEPAAIPGLVTAVGHEGSAGSATTISFAVADSIPIVVRRLKSA